MLLTSSLLVVSVTVVLICFLYLIQFDEQIPPSGVRRHDGSNTVWPTAPYNAADMDDTIVIGKIVVSEPARHAMHHDVNEHDLTIEPYNSTGRHSIENHARTIVPADWMPPLGTTRIALIETPTSEYLIARKPKSLPSRTHTRLRDELVGPPIGFVRRYVPNPDMVNA